MADVPGYGTKLEYGNKGDGTSTTWTSVGEIVSIDPPTFNVSDIDTTHMATAGKIRTFQPGLVDPGDLKMTVHFTATIYTALVALVGVMNDFRITYNDKIATAGSTDVFQGYIKELGTKTPLDGVDTFDITYKVSGAPVFTAAT